MLQNIKKGLFLLVALLTVFSASAYSFSAVNDDGVTIYYNVTYSTSPYTVAVTYMNTSYNSYSGDIKIPSTVTSSNKTYSVTSIEINAFYNCSSLTSVTIPNTVTSIGDQVFSQCSSLTSVTIPKTVTSIGIAAFSGCSSLTSVTIPESVTSIEMHAFNGCIGLTSVTIPESVTSIGNYAFSNCSGLTSMTIPESVTSIGDGAFSSCRGLTSVTIPNSVTSIGYGAFSSCIGLTSVTIPESVTSIGYGAFSSCRGLTSFYGKYASEDNRCLIKDKALIAFAPSGLTSYAIPESVTTIGYEVFSGCRDLTYVAIPESVTSIEGRAFSDCSGLTSMTIPESVTSIGDEAFSFCSGLTSVTIPNSVTSIGDMVFMRCSGLTSVTIPNSVTLIGPSAFSDCSGLTSVTIPNSVTFIGSFAFSYCSGLTSVTISESVTSIGNNAFYNCSKLKTVVNYSALDIVKGATSNGYVAYYADQVITGIRAESITLNKTSVKLKAGDTETLVATVLPENTTDKTVTWASSDEAIATVDSEGKVSAVGIGTATITATCGDVSATCEVTVSPVPAESVTLNKASLELLIGGSETLVATVKPDDTTYKTITWTSSNEAIATIDSDGKVTAIALGTATITATCGSVSATCEVTVNPVPAESITLDKIEAEILVGYSVTLTATVLPDDTTFKTVTWTSSDEDIATVDENGTVTGIGVGSTTITATCGSVYATCDITVNPVPAESVTLNAESIELKEGESVKILATVYPEETTFKDIEWSSSDDEIATVDNDGNVTAVSEGSATITATCGEVYATCVVIVTAESGIENVKADGNGRYIVWNMQGTKILDPENAKDIRYLPEGFYIINGTKVLLK